MTATPCQYCAEPIPAGNRFCGMCGAPLAGGPPTASTALWAAPEAKTAIYPATTAEVYPPIHAAPPHVSMPPAPSVVRRFRGPLWVGGIGTILLLAGAGTVSTILSAIQLEGTGMLVDLFGPLVESQVEGAVGVDVIDLGDGESVGLSTFTLTGLVVGSIFALIGLVMVIVACAWAASRSLGRRGPGTVTIAAAPTPVQYAPPSFAKATPPTFATPPPPDQPPAAPPTFTTRPRSGPPR